jgi:MYXO-CTERM domain-containing protein
MAGLLLGAPSLRADNIVAHASKDTTLYQDAVGGLGGGKGVDFFVGRLGTLGSGALRRAPIAFDLSGIPTTATITNVTLTLTQQKGNGGPQPIDLHRLTSNWGEGTSTGGPQGTLAAANDATWTFNFFNLSSWSNPGGDFSATVSGTASADFSGPVVWNSTPQLVSDVQGWVSNPSTNFGWILIGNEGTEQTAKEFASKDNFLGQPQLAVTFSVPEPGAAALGGAGLLLLTRRRRSAAR